jgi:hypothetical protein
MDSYTETPFGYRNETLIRNLMEKKVGKVEEIQTNVQGAGMKDTDLIDINFFKFKYEKMPRFCGACRFIGHSHLECGTGEHVKDDLKWGDWLKADWDTWHGRAAPGAREEEEDLEEGEFLTLLIVVVEILDVAVIMVGASDAMHFLLLMVMLS